MGVTTGKVTAEAAGPVLAQFYATIDSAQDAFTLTQKQRAADEYAAVEEATKALRLGKARMRPPPCSQPRCLADLSYKASRLTLPAGRMTPP